MSETLKHLGEEFLEAKKLFDNGLKEEYVKKMDLIVNRLKDLPETPQINEIDQDIREVIPAIYYSLSTDKNKEYNASGIGEYIEGCSKLFKKFAEMNGKG